MSVRPDAYYEYSPSSKSMADRLFDLSDSLRRAIEERMAPPVLRLPLSAKEDPGTADLRTLLASCTVPELKQLHESNGAFLPRAQKKLNLVESLLVSLPFAWRNLLDLVNAAMASVIMQFDKTERLNEKVLYQVATQIQFLLSRGFLFAVQSDDGLSFVMPTELRRTIQVLRKPELQQQIKRNSDLCMMGQNLVVMTGVMSRDSLYRYLDELVQLYDAGRLDTLVQISEERDRRTRLTLAPDTCAAFPQYAAYSDTVDQVILADHGRLGCFCHCHVLSPHDLYQQQLDRPTLLFRPYSCRDLLESVQTDIVKAAELVRYLTTHGHLDQKTAERIVPLLTIAIKNGLPNMTCIQWLMDTIRPVDMARSQALLNYLNGSYINSISRWILKGYSSEQVVRMMPPDQGRAADDQSEWVTEADEWAETQAIHDHLGISPADIEKIRQMKPIDIPVNGHQDSTNEPVAAAGVKPGRNDPCPCGSGKKYKKCCGRA